MKIGDTVYFCIRKQHFRGSHVEEEEARVISFGDEVVVAHRDVSRDDVLDGVQSTLFLRREATFMTPAEAEAWGKDEANFRSDSLA